MGAVIHADRRTDPEPRANLGPEFGLSDRHQRNRFNAWLSWNAPWDLDVNVRLSYRDNQPRDVLPNGMPIVGFPPSGRCIPICTVGGDVFQRNQGEEPEFRSLE